MPALENPRHEAYAQAFFHGLSNGGTQEKAYIAAGYSVTNKNSANACASRLMLRIANRVRELQDEANQRIQPKIDISRQRVGQRLHKASVLAEQLNNPAAMATSELGIAKVFGFIGETEKQQIDYTTCQSMAEIGCKLLQSVGFARPDDVSIQQALELNNVFVAGLERIRDERQQLTIEHQPQP